MGLGRVKWGKAGPERSCGESVGGVSSEWDGGDPSGGWGGGWGDQAGQKCGIGIMVWGGSAVSKGRGQHEGIGT